MNDLVKSVRATGGIGVVGVFVPEDPGAADELAKKGKIVFDYGEMWNKGLTLGTGQCPVKRYNRHLCSLIERGKAEPSFIVSHECSLEEASDAYAHFDARDEGWTKVVLKPELQTQQKSQRTSAGQTRGAPSKGREHAHASKKGHGGERSGTE
jgi:glutathione-independent formaldehyde dehydrogenase